MREYRAALDETRAPLSRGSPRKGSRAGQVCDTLQTCPERSRRKGNPFDITIEWLLVGLLAFMPLAFGVVHAWSEEVVIILSGTIVICFLLKLLYHRDQSLIWTWAYVSLGIFLLIPIIQLIPLPATLVKIISPNTAALRTELLGDLPNADTFLRSMTLSFYPYATKHDLRLVLAIAAIFVVVLNVFHRAEQIKRLLMAIALIGGIIALITLGQNLFGNSKIYWFISSRNSEGYSGPFVNQSNYGQFMNLSIGAAFGLFLVKLHEGFASKKITPAAISEYFSSGSAKVLWLLILMMSLCVATVFVSLTRGGMLSMLIAITFTTLLLAWRRLLKGHGWIIVVMALIAFTLVLYIGFDAVYDRLVTLRDFHEAKSGRLQILKDIAVAWTKFPILGTGLGTHLTVYPMFDRSTITALAAHAENEYAQALEETGLIGLASLIIFGIIIWSNYAKSTRSAKLPICSVAYGIGFGILAILIHSLSDFGQHLPANVILSAIFCALLLGLAQKEKKNACDIKTSRRFGISIGLRAVILLGVCGIWIWASVGANRARIAEAHWEKARAAAQNLKEKDWQGNEQEYVTLIAHASMASDYQPDNIRYRYWLNVYRWRTISRIPELSSVDITVPENLIPSIHRIVDDLNKTRPLCPTYGPVYGFTGWLEKFILKNNKGAESIRKGFRLAPCNPRICLLAGHVDVLEGRYEGGIGKFNRTVELDGRLFKDVVNIYINHLSRPHLAISAARDDIGRLSHVANLLEDMEYIDLAEQSREKIQTLLEGKCSQRDASASAFASLAAIYRKQQNNKAAVEFYRRALALNYSQVGWRLELAKLLMEMGKIPEAMREAKICLQLHPQSKAAQKLVADLSVNLAVFDKEMMGGR